LTNKIARRRILTRQYYDRIEYLMRTGAYNPVLDLTKIADMIDIKPANYPTTVVAKTQ
jgi:hypothetical protein